MGPKRPELSPPATPGQAVRIGPAASLSGAHRAESPRAELRALGRLPPAAPARAASGRRSGDAPAASAGDGGAPGDDGAPGDENVAAYYKELYEEEKRRREVLEVIAWQNNTPLVAHAAPPGKYPSVRFVESPLTSPVRIMTDLLAQVEGESEKAKQANAEADSAEADFERIFQAFVGLAQDLHYDKAHGEETIPDETVRSLKSRVEEVTDLHPHLMELSAQFAEGYDPASPVFRVSTDLSREGARKLRQETERDVRMLGEAIRNQ